MHSDICLVSSQWNLRYCLNFICAFHFFFFFLVCFYLKTRERERKKDAMFLGVLGSPQNAYSSRDWATPKAAAQNQSTCPGMAREPVAGWISCCPQGTHFDAVAFRARPSSVARGLPGLYHRPSFPVSTSTAVLSLAKYFHTKDNWNFFYWNSLPPDFLGEGIIVSICFWHPV